MTDLKYVSRGFTVLELIVALAIAVVLIVAVNSVTHALTDTARRQRELSEQALRREKFAELLRRDLRGWLAHDVISVPASKTGDDFPILQFCTLADGLSSNYSSSGNGTRAIPSVQYFVRKGVIGYDIIRVENGTAGGTFEMRLLQCADQPHVEFYTAGGWIDKWNFSRKPSGIRVIIGTNVFEVFLV